MTLHYNTTLWILLFWIKINDLKAGKMNQWVISLHQMWSRCSAYWEKKNLQPIKKQKTVTGWDSDDTKIISSYSSLKMAICLVAIISRWGACMLCMGCSTLLSSCHSKVGMQTWEFSEEHWAVSSRTWVKILEICTKILKTCTNLSSDWLCSTS